jgi:hypothetical protein
MSLVYLCRIVPGTTDKRCWYVAMKEFLDDYRRPRQQPLFDDAEAKPVEMTFAQEACRRWKEEFGWNTFITVEKYGQPIAADGGQSSEQDMRQPMFVPFTNNLGLTAFPASRPSGRCWAIRAVDVPAFQQDKRFTTIETIFGQTPEDAAQRAVDSWGQEILFRDPNQDARDQQAAREAQQQKSKTYLPNIRPGDRRQL